MQEVWGERGEGQEGTRALPCSAPVAPRINLITITTMRANNRTGATRPVTRAFLLSATLTQSSCHGWDQQLGPNRP